MIVAVVFAMGLTITSCGGSSAVDIANKWCELDKKVGQAENEEDKDKARDERAKYENEMEEKYKDDKDFLKEVRKLSKDCD